jgi:hypothetical protein
MMNVESYRQYAADCVRQAQQEPTPEERNIVLNLALAWLRLARQTEAMKDEADTEITPDDDDAAAEAETEQQLAS